MDYQKLNDTITVSRIALGTWGMGGDYFGKTDDTVCVRTVEQALDSGINFIDTAPSYGEGHAEYLVGKALKTKRNKTVIATKCGLLKKNNKHYFNLSKSSIEYDLKQSLKRLNTDYIDIYLVHWPDNKTTLDDVILTLTDLIDKGYILSYGLCNYKSQDVDNKTAKKIIGIQLQNTILDYSKTKIVGEFVDRGIPVFSYGIFGGGILSNGFSLDILNDALDNRNYFYDYYNASYLNKIKILYDMLKEYANLYNATVNQILISYYLNNQYSASCIIGMRSNKHIEENINGVNIKLDQQHINKINQLCKFLF